MRGLDLTTCQTSAAALLPPVEYDVSKLPPAVQRRRAQIIQAAASGELNQLRPVFEANGGPPQLSCEDLDDPIDCLRSLSGDQKGPEIPADLLSALEAGFVHVEVGTPEEMYVWPYFAMYPLDKLTPAQLVELFKLLTAADVADMSAYCEYPFYRVGIGPEGTWKYFVGPQ